jgi:DNA-binding SARP family transcriptional activator
LPPQVDPGVAEAGATRAARRLAATSKTAAALERMCCVVDMRPPSEGSQMPPSLAAHGSLTAVAFGLGRSYNPAVPEFRILGPLEVLAADGEQLDLGSQRQRAVLAALLLRANDVVSTEFLVDALWGEQPPRTANTSLQNSIVALRKLLGAELVQTKPPGYRLVVDPESIDLSRFERLVGAARGLDPPERAERLREALALWRGEPLAEIAFEPFAAPEARRLEELRLATTEELMDAELALEHFAEVVVELGGLVERNPLREQLVAQLMLALYHSGRQTDALQAYDAARRALDEFGLYPSPQLQELHRQIIRQDVPRPRAAATVADESHFEEVAAVLLASRLVPVLGGDLSPLAELLAHRFNYQEDGRELTRVAQFVALTKGAGPLHDELHVLLDASAAPTPVHRFFASLPKVLRDRGLPHQLLVTTSYDLALEQALLDAGEEFDVVSYVASGRDRGRFCHRAPTGDTRVIDLPNMYATELSLERRTIVLKLHGGLEGAVDHEHERFVVTEDDYIEYLAHGDVGGAIPVALAAKLRRSHFLFLGYGMREWSLRLVLDRMSGGERFAYQSWAVVPDVKPLERQFWRSRDVDLIELQLPEYVDALGRYLGVGRTETAA